MTGPSNDQQSRLANRRVFFLANPDKPEASEAMRTLQGFAESRCNVVGAELGLDGAKAIDAKADRIVVLGGDGTLIAVARSLGASQIPLIGVNVGKLGFLAEFSTDELMKCFDGAVSDDAGVGRRTILQLSVIRNGKIHCTSLAVNDCVIQAGPPFRIIHLGVSIKRELTGKSVLPVTDIAGDGLIICTSSGSTAHNLSAGGPIMQAGVPAIVLTPLSPHSLTHRPLVIECGSVIDIQADSVNEGTTVIIDGQVSYALSQGDQVSIRRFDHDFLLVRNPLTPDWHNLVSKLHWGRQPNYDH